MWLHYQMWTRLVTNMILHGVLTYLSISCLTLGYAEGCSSSSTLPPPVSGTPGQERCSYDITPIEGTDVLRINFTFNRYTQLQLYQPVEFTDLVGEGCMCQEGYEEEGGFKVQLYDERCPFGICPKTTDAYLTCNCTREACKCYEDEDTSEDPCFIPGMDILPRYTAPISRTCYDIGDEDSRRKRQAADPTAPLTWIFCVCNQSQSIEICECPNPVTITTPFTPTTEVTTEATTSPLITDPNTTPIITTIVTSPADEIITTRPVTTKGPLTTTKAPTRPAPPPCNDDDDDDISCGNSGEEFQALSNFELQCQGTTTRPPYTTTSMMLTSENVPIGAPTGANELRVLILLLLAALAVILIIIGVVMMCMRQKRSYDIKNTQDSRKTETPHRGGGKAQIMETTVISNADHEYGHLNLPSQTQPQQNRRQPTEPALYADPDVIPRGAPIAYEDIDLQNQDPIPYAPQGRAIPYEDIDLPNQHHHPTQYASTAVNGRHQDNDKTEYATAYSHIPNNRGTSTSSQAPLLSPKPSAIPSYAKVNKGKKQSSFDIESGTVHLNEATSGQQHEYGKLKPVVTAAAGGVLYHKLDRGLNGHIVASAQ